MRTITKQNIKGFTLTEVIVVVVLMSILALGAFSLFMMYTNTTRETAANMRLQRQSDAVVSEIGRWVRDGASVDTSGGPLNKILAVRDTAITQPPPASSLPGYLIAAFRLVRQGEHGVVQMIRPDPPADLPDVTGAGLWNNADFLVGGQRVFVDFDSSGFAIRGGTSVEVDLVLQDSTVTYKQRARGGFTTRNR